MEDLRRCGAHQVILPDGSILQQAVVEIQEGRVVNYFEFREELPMTEWLGGEIRVERDEDGILRALWSPDFPHIQKSIRDYLSYSCL